MNKCPGCESQNVVKNGRIHTGKQNYKCKDCGRQFVLDPTWREVDETTKERIDKLLLERVFLAGIARVEGVSESWLQSYVNEKYSQVEQKVTIKAKKGL